MRVGTTNKRVAATLAVSVTVALVTSSAGASPADADFQVDIGVGSGGPPALVPSGGTARVASRNFTAAVFVKLNTPQPASAIVRFELSDGLGWGTGGVLPNCTRTPTTAECQTALLTPGQISMVGSDHWSWDVVASQVGSYTVKAEIAGTSMPDPVLSNNAATVTVVVTDPPPPPEPPPPPAAVTASAAKVTPAKPKAGTAVAATVSVTTGGAPVRPTGLACAGTISTTKLTGSPKAASGSATCVYRTSKAAKGKTLRGAISFSARGTKFTRRFATKLS